MSVSSQAKRRAADLHNRQYEAKKNRHYARPLFNYLQQLCYPLELVRQERGWAAGSQHKRVLAAALMATYGDIGTRNFGGESDG